MLGVQLLLRKPEGSDTWALNASSAERSSVQLLAMAAAASTIDKVTDPCNMRMKRRASMCGDGSALAD